MHDCALEWNRERGLASAPRVEHTCHCPEISTKNTLQKHIKIDEVNGGTYIANSLIYPSWLRGRKVDKTDRLPQVLKDIQSEKTIKWDERR